MEIFSVSDGNSLFEVKAALDINCGNITNDEDLREFVSTISITSLILIWLDTIYIGNHF